MSNNPPAEPARFGRGIITEWYDGAVHGYLEAGRGGPTYAYQMVAWDIHTSRIYVLRPLAGWPMDDIATAHFGAGAALDAWRPVMAPDPIDRPRVSEIDRAMGRPELIVLANDADLPSPKAILRIEDDQIAEVESWVVEDPDDGDGLSCSNRPFEHWIALFE